MPWDRVLPALAALAAPLLGLALRGSPRTRLRHRITEYLEIADELSEHSPDAASRFRDLASQAAKQLADRESKQLSRRVDPAAIAALLLLVIPALAVIYFAWSWETGWRFVVIPAAIVWSILWTIAGLTQIRTEREPSADEA